MRQSLPIPPIKLALIFAAFGIYLIGTVIPDGRFASGLLMLAILFRPIDLGHGDAVERFLNIGSLVLIFLPALLFQASVLALAHTSGRLTRNVIVWIFITLSLMAAADIFFTGLLNGVFGTEASAAISALVALTVFSWTLLFITLILEAITGGSSRRTLWTRWISGSIIVLITTWSIVSGISAAAQALDIASGRPYCIAHTRPRPYVTLASIFDIRGTNFYTDVTGYKSTSRWYFHAVLVAGNDYWNWSIRSMRFDRIERPHRQFDLVGACEPTRGFLARLFGAYS